MFMDKNDFIENEMSGTAPKLFLFVSFFPPKLYDFVQ